MTASRKVIRAAIVAAALVGLLLFSDVYYIQDQAWGDLFWNAESAYVFIGIDSRGSPYSLLGFAVEVVREMFPFGASAPRDRHSSVVVLRITPDSVQRYSQDDFWLSTITPFQGVLYTNNRLHDRESVKWSGFQFEPTTPDEDSKFIEYFRSSPELRPKGPSYDNLQGWSKRAVAGEVVSESSTVSVEKDARVTIELNGKPLTFVMNSGFLTQEAYIDFMRPNQPPERIWYLDERSHRVSKTEYERMFPRPTSVK